MGLSQDYRDLLIWRDAPLVPVIVCGGFVVNYAY